jgi:hypothetical protein
VTGAELGITDREFAPGAQALVEHLHMARTGHRPQRHLCACGGHNRRDRPSKCSHADVVDGDFDASLEGGQSAYLAWVSAYGADFDEDMESEGRKIQAFELRITILLM